MQPPPPQKREQKQKIQLEQSQIKNFIYKYSHEDIS